MQINFTKTDCTNFFYELFIPFDIESGLSLGKDFEICLSYEIDPESNRDITIYNKGGIMDHFVYTIDRFLCTRGKAESLVKMAPGKYRLKQKDGTMLFFNDPFSCKVTDIFLCDGRHFYYTYNNQKQLLSIKNNSGYTISFIRNNGQISEITETIDLLQNEK
jgi:hypothetical protein